MNTITNADSSVRSGDDSSDNISGEVFDDESEDAYEHSSDEYSSSSDEK